MKAVWVKYGEQLVKKSVLKELGHMMEPDIHLQAS